MSEQLVCTECGGIDLKPDSSGQRCERCGKLFSPAKLDRPGQMEEIFLGTPSWALPSDLPDPPPKELVVPGYEPLYFVLMDALDQAQKGKGAKCHADSKPWLDQPIMRGVRECGAGSMAYQARKKILEALKCDDDERAIEDLLGAMNYAAAMIIARREGVR